MDKVSEDDKPRRSWPLWKKLAVAAVALVIIALAVGLGVGLTRGGGGGDNEGDDQGDGGDEGPGTRPNRTTTWKPEVKASWQIILKSPLKSDGEDTALNPDVDIYDLDLFDNDAATFAGLQDAGKKVICYFSAGSYENFRPDKDQFDDADLGKALDGWPGERWLNLSSPNVRDIMKQRIKMAWSKGCDAIDPDNVDGFQNDNDLGLTSQDSIDFIKFLSDEAGKYHLAIGLKNAGSIIRDVLDLVGFSVNEQCVQYEECETFAAFIEAGKPVFHIEYPDGAPNRVSTDAVDEICSHRGKAAGAEDFSTVIKNIDLDGWVEYCDGKKYTTETED